GPEGHGPADDAADARGLQAGRRTALGPRGAGAVADLPPDVDHGAGPHAAHRLARGRSDGPEADARVDQGTAGRGVRRRGAFGPPLGVTAAGGWVLLSGRLRDRLRPRRPARTPLPQEPDHETDPGPSERAAVLPSCPAASAGKAGRFPRRLR